MVVLWVETVAESRLPVATRARVVLAESAIQRAGRSPLESLRQKQVSSEPLGGPL